MKMDENYKIQKEANTTNKEIEKDKADEKMNKRTEREHECVCVCVCV
jgi:hypothetical protein